MFKFYGVGIFQEPSQPTSDVAQVPSTTVQPHQPAARLSSGYGSLPAANGHAGGKTPKPKSYHDDSDDVSDLY